MQASAKIQSDLVSCKLSETPSLKKKKKEKRALGRGNSSKHNVILQTNAFRNNILFGSNRAGKEQLKMQLMWNALNAHVKLPTHYPCILNQGGLPLQKWLLTKLSGPIYCLGNCPYFVCFLFP